MSTLLAPPPAPRAAPPALLTAEEFYDRYGRGGYELVKGVVQEVAMPGARHGKVCVKVARVLDEFFEANSLGHVMSNDTLMLLRRGPDSMRGADVCFVSHATLPKDAVPDGPLEVIPELVFEVRSPSDPWTEVIEKMLDYVKAGVKVVVILDPKTKSASVFRPTDRQEILEADQTLTLPDVLPDFALVVGKLFE